MTASAPALEPPVAPPVPATWAGAANEEPFYGSAQSGQGFDFAREFDAIFGGEKKLDDNGSRWLIAELEFSTPCDHITITPHP